MDRNHHSQVFGKNVRFYREKAKWTQEDLADKSGVSCKFIQALEGKNPPSPNLNTVHLLAKSFSIEPSALIDSEIADERKVSVASVVAKSSYREFQKIKKALIAQLESVEASLKQLEQ